MPPSWPPGPTQGGCPASPAWSAPGCSPRTSAAGSRTPTPTGCRTTPRSWSGSTPTKADSDADGLSDGAEAALGTDPLLADTDHDGLTDELEVEYGSDPLGSFVDSTGRMVKTAPWTLEAAYARRKPSRARRATTSPAGGTTTVRTRPGPRAAVGGGDPYAIDPGQPSASRRRCPGRSRSTLDTDRDGLTDAFEKLAGTKADRGRQRRRRAQRRLRGAEVPDRSAGRRHRQRRADRCPGGRAPGATRAGFPGVAGVVGTGALAENVRDGIKDADSDGLSDRAEKLVGTDAKKADTRWRQAVRRHGDRLRQQPAAGRHRPRRDLRRGRGAVRDGPAGARLGDGGRASRSGNLPAAACLARLPADSPADGFDAS